eukprot:1217370-Amphidinium_carterae.1
MENATATGQVASLPEMRLDICGLVAHAADEIAVNAKDVGWQHVWAEPPLRTVSMRSAWS